MALGFSMHSGEDEQPLNAILGSGINQDGRSSSLTAPNGPSQQQARLNPAVQSYCAGQPMGSLSICRFWTVQAALLLLEVNSLRCCRSCAWHWRMRACMLPASAAWRCMARGLPWAIPLRSVQLQLCLEDPPGSPACLLGLIRRCA